MKWTVEIFWEKSTRIKFGNFPEQFITSHFMQVAEVGSNLKKLTADEILSQVRAKEEYYLKSFKVLKSPTEKGEPSEPPVKKPVKRTK